MEDDPKNKARILDISRGSGKEVESLLYLGAEIGYLEDDEFKQLLSMSDDTIGLVCGWQRSIYKR